MVTTQNSDDEHSWRDAVRDERRDERSSITKLFLESNPLTKFDERTSDIIPNSMDECNLKNVHWLQLRTQSTNIVSREAVRDERRCSSDGLLLRTY